MDAPRDLLSVVIRLHTTSRDAMAFLSKALLSLLGATHRPLEVIVVTQQFSSAQLEELQQVVAGFSWDPACAFSTINYRNSDSGDHRSALLNLGVRAATGRYLAFLDYDDYVYPHAYETLIRQLDSTNSCIAFGGCVVAQAALTPHGYKIVSKHFPYTQKTEEDFLADNIFPIHSYVIDRSRLPQPLPAFNESLSRLEDYEFLLRLRLLTPFDMTCRVQKLVEYFYRKDGTNTSADQKSWEQSHATLRPLKEAVRQHLRANSSAQG